MKKKVVCIFLILTLVFSCFPIEIISVYASTSYTEPTIIVESKYTALNSLVEVKVNIENNPGIAGATLNFSYDSKLRLIKAENGDAFSDLSLTVPGEFSNPCDFLWDSVTGQVQNNGTLLTLTFQVSDEAVANDKLNINASYHLGDIYNEDMESLNLQMVNGCITVINYIPGDVNGDGQVNGKDVTLIRRNIVGGYDLKINKAAADVNEDERINGKDITLIRRFIVGGHGVELKPSKPKCEHVMNATSYKAATCTENGNIAYWHCSVCDKYFSDSDGATEITLDNTVINATGHTYIIDKAVPATYESTGLTEGSHCGVCNTIIQKQEVIPMLQKNEYAITYNIDNNDNYLKQQTIQNNNPNSYTLEEGLVLYDLMVDGYRFKGWYTAQTGGTRVTEIPAGSKGNKVLYAQWEKVEYTIMFDSPDVPISNVTYTVDKGITLTSPTCFGYTFVGWSIDGEIISVIPPGTTGNITLHANWTSNRNKATAVSKLDSPNIIEDMDNGRYLFVYEIGMIENTPLSQIEYIGNSQGININREYEYSVSVGEGYADTVAKTVSNATTKTSAWTLSEDWNKTTSATNEHDEQIGKTEQKTDSHGNVIGSKYYVSNGSGGSTSSSSSGGGSKSSSSKVTTGNSTGINGSYTGEHETGSSVNLHADASLSAGLKTSAGANIGPTSASAETSISGEISAGIAADSTKKDKETNTIANSRTDNFGTDNTDSNESHWESSSSSSSTWNSEKGYETSSSISNNTEVSNTISQIIYDRYAYTSTDSRGGNNSSTKSTGESQELKDEYASTIEYSTEEKATVKKTITYSSNATGYYRLVTAGTVHVFAVVGYDIATNSYFTYTYNVLDKERHEYLDYSKNNANFNDCENAILPFEIPFYVHEYISSVIARSDKLTVDSETGTITEYNGDAEYVVIPEYVSINNGDGTFSAKRIRGFKSEVFKGNTNIKGVSLPKYIYEIPNSAFEGCTSLETVIGYGVSEIGDYAFKDCRVLKSFSIDKYITHLGTNAFVNVPEIKVSAANVSVADATINSGAKRISLNISNMEGSFDNKTIFIDKSTEYFALMSNGSTYNDLQIESKANETFISNMKFTKNSSIPLKLDSETVSLSRVTVEKSPGFALVITNDNASLNLFGTVALSSLGENTVMSKNVIMNKADMEVVGTLKVTGNYLVCGEISNSKMIDIESGKIVNISKEEFNSMLTTSIVSFDANGGTVSDATKTVYYGQSYGKLPEPTCKNYNFEGWYTSKSGGTKITTDTIVTTLVNQTLYAHWSANEFTVTFDANGGSVSSANKKVVFGDKYGELPVPKKDYYTFQGWFTQPNDGEGEEVTENSVAMKAEDITVYAHWKLNELSEFVKSSEVPEGAQVVNQKWSYNLTSYTTSNSSTIDGWTQYDKTSKWSDYGAWSAWQDNYVGGSESREVQTQSVVASENYKTVYHYYRYSVNREGGYGSYAQSSSYPNYYEYDFDSPLEYYKDVYGHAGYKWWYSSSHYVTVYQRSPFTTQEVVSYNYKTQYRYRDRSLVYTYYFKKVDNLESASYPTGNNISNIQEWVQYRTK